MKKVYIRHVIEAGYCTYGLRSWAKFHNLSMKDFLEDGIDIEILRKLDDALAQRVIAVAERDESGR